RSLERRVAGRTGRGQHPPLPPGPLPAPAPGEQAGADGRAAAGVRPGHRFGHATPQRPAHHPGRRTDRLEVLPVPGAAVHGNLPRPLLPRPRRPAAGAQCAHCGAERDAPGSGPDRGIGRVRGSASPAQQDRVLDGHRQRQNTAHACQHPPVPVETHGLSRDLNRIILLTPNEGLSQQHLREFQKSGIEAEIFNKDGRGRFAGRAVEILEVTKLKEEMGEKTVAVDAFEGNNLVLVDEGHRGASAGGDGAWMKFRNALCEKGFSFEYSATFGQAVAGNRDLTDLYARSTLLDYSYRWFYGDGFGKDYHILNLEDDRNEEWMRTYLTACLLSFFQQQRLYREQEASLRPFNIEKPLWVFVGGSVNAVRKEDKKDVSDVVAILKFLATYVANRQDSTERIRRVLNEGLLTATGKNLFAGRFAYLNTCGLSPEQIFDETLATLCNSPAGGLLHIENLKGAAGEIGVRVGDNAFFGV